MPIGLSDRTFMTTILFGLVKHFEVIMQNSFIKENKTEVICVYGEEKITQRLTDMWVGQYSLARNLLRRE